VSSTSDKVKGVGNQVVGRAKQAVGDIASDKELRQEGVDQELKGIDQQAIGDAKAAAKKVIDEG
jgi:uncharacterized protein YjbJ (UPF0337 family)